MPDAKISNLTELAEVPASTDEFVIVDKSDTTQAASGTTKRIKSQYITPTEITRASASGPTSFAFSEDTDNGTNKITIIAPAAVASDKVLTLPDATDTLVGKDTIDTLTNKTLTSPKVGTAITDTNGNEVIKTPATASAVNEVTITNAATAGLPDISPTGDDTNISMSMQGKGTGKIEVELPISIANATSTSGTSSTPFDVTASSVSFTIKKTSHVKLTFMAGIQNNTGARYMQIRFMRDSTVLKDRFPHIVQAGINTNFVGMYLDASLVAGTYTYKMQMASSNGTDTVVVNDGTLLVEAIIA